MSMHPDLFGDIQLFNSFLLSSFGDCSCHLLLILPPKNMHQLKYTYISHASMHAFVFLFIYLTFFAKHDNEYSIEKHMKSAKTAPYNTPKYISLDPGIINLMVASTIII